MQKNGQNNMKYNIIYADVPHMYQQFSDAKNGAVKPQYTTMHHTELAKLPINEISDKNSVLLFWATFPKLPESLYIMESWGFKYKTCAFVWNKQFKNGNPYMGLGFYTRSGSEIVLLGTKGKPLPRKSHSVRQVINAPVNRHSSKPPIIREKIVELFGDLPRLEIFGRPPIIQGWDMMGYEITGNDVKVDLQNIIDGKFHNNPGIPISHNKAIEIANETLNKAEDERTI